MKRIASIILLLPMFWNLIDAQHMAAYLDFRNRFMIFDHGETKEVENGETHSYPIGFDADGNPTKHETVRDGLTMRSTLSLLPNRQPKLAIAVEDSHIVKWNKSPDGNKTPVCKVTTFGTTVRPKWGQWQNVGKAMATETDKGQVILVRVDKPSKQPSNN